MGFLPTRIVPSNDIGALAAVLIYRMQIKWDWIRALAFRRVSETGLTTSEDLTHIYPESTRSQQVIQRESV